MSASNHLLRLGAALVIGGALTTCVISPLDDPRIGVVTMTWTLDGSSDPGRCADTGTELVHVVVRDASESVAVDSFVPCERFGERYLLHRGWYMGTLTPVDARLAATAASRDTYWFFVGVSTDTRVFVDLPARLPVD